MDRSRNRLFLSSKSSSSSSYSHGSRGIFGIQHKQKILQQQCTEVKQEYEHEQQDQHIPNEQYEVYEDDRDYEEQVNDDYGNMLTQQQTFEEYEDEDDYPDISEFVQTEFEEENLQDDEEDRGLPPAGSRATPQAGYYYGEDEEELQDDETEQVLNSLPPGIVMTKTTKPRESSSSARTSSQVNNFLRNSLVRNNGNRFFNHSNAIEETEDDENLTAEDYYQDLSVQKRNTMSKQRNVRPQLSASALLEQLQAPVYTKPNILSRKLNAQLQATQSNGNGSSRSAPPPPRLQPRPNKSSSSSQSVSLESILRLQVSAATSTSSNKPMPRLHTIPKSGSKHYVVDGRKLSFKSGNQSQRTSNPSTRSLESLMLSHQRSQLSQQLNSGKNLDQGIMFGNLQIRQVSTPMQSSKHGLIRQKNVPRCQVCRKTFATNQVLQRHIASVHGAQFVEQTNGNGEMHSPDQQVQNGGTIHRCRVCYRTFGSLESLRAHSLNHEGEFKCRACRRGFPSWEVLEQHEATHKKYECRWCEKYFMNSGNLKAHERIHTGERPYSCADCSKAFKQLGGLQYHLKTNPTHRPQKYKMEEQDNSPQDYSGTMLISNSNNNGEDGMYMDDDEQQSVYVDIPAGL
ncbi:putative zinc finger protein [Orchesella cincta]|uniref:Putative zinc finger protein n=1 Tax=Orchesella cincta TaxID=48709 RepID=A0A1D2N8K9_ORCCI|nr:putative zinc finger protein [Orchesella cincta]